jgi:hypothetical protein
MQYCDDGDLAGKIKDMEKKEEYFSEEVLSEKKKML